MNQMGQEPEPERSRRLFAPLPVEGPWTALHLGRGQFLGILAASCLTFVFWSGPLWRHLGGRDFGRIALSYALIPFLVALAQARNGQLRPGPFLAATGVLATLKLVATAGLDLILGMALGVR